MNEKNIVLCIEAIALIVGLIALKTIKPTYLKIIVVLLLLTCINEWAVNFLPSLAKTRYRFLAYNIFSLIEAAFWFCFFLKVFASNARLKRLIAGMGLLLLVFSLIELSVYRNWFRFHTDSYRVYSLSIILFSVLYFLKMIRVDEVYHPLHDPVFWFCSGCIIFHSVFFVHLTVVNMEAFKSDRESIKVFNTLLSLANMFYYACLSVGFCISIRNNSKWAT